MSVASGCLAVTVMFCGLGPAVSQDAGMPTVNAMHHYDDANGHRISRLIRGVEGMRYRVIQCYAEIVDECALVESYLDALVTVYRDAGAAYRYLPDGDVEASLTEVLEGGSRTFHGRASMEADGETLAGTFTNVISLGADGAFFGEGVIALHHIETATFDDTPVEAIYYIRRESRALEGFAFVEESGEEEFRFAESQMLTAYEARSVESAVASGDTGRGLSHVLCSARVVEAELPAEVVARIPANTLDSPVPRAAFAEMMEVFQQANADAFTPETVERLHAGEQACIDAL